MGGKVGPQGVSWRPLFHSWPPVLLCRRFHCDSWLPLRYTFLPTELCQLGLLETGPRDVPETGINVAEETDKG